MATDIPRNPGIAIRAHTATERWLLKQIAKKIGVEPLSADSTFETLGMKPLDFIELVMTAEENLAIELPDSICMPCKTPAELAARIVERTARPIPGDASA